MSANVVLNIDTTAFVIGENLRALREDAAVILQDAGRSAVLAPFTLMGKIASTAKWVPFTDETSVLGDAEFFGIYMGPEILAATLVAGDVVDVPVIYSGLKFDEDKLVIENSKTLATIIAAAGLAARTVRSALVGQDLIAKTTDVTTHFENA